MARKPVERLEALRNRVLTGRQVVEDLRVGERQLRSVGMADVARRLRAEAHVVSDRMREAEKSALKLGNALLKRGGGARTIDLIESYFEDLSLDPKTGKHNPIFLQTKRVRQILDELGGGRKPVAIDAVLRLAVERGLDRPGARRALDRVLREGAFYQLPLQRVLLPRAARGRGS